MVSFAIDGITSFSVLPLRFATYMGMLMILASVGVIIWALVAKFVLHQFVQGWTGMMIVIAVFASVQLLMIGILGEYIGRIYEEVKRRPLYIVGDTVNATKDDDQDDGAV
jgi:dolichol-phosphate mannosyltransferase